MNSRKTSMSASLLCKSLWLCGSQQIVENSERYGYTRLPYCVFWETYTHPGQKATVRTLLGTTDWFKIRKGVWHGCILSPCLFYLYAGYITRNSRLDESQAGIKIARWNINSLTHADDTTLMAESEEELKSLLMTVKEKSESEVTQLCLTLSRLVIIFLSRSKCLLISWLQSLSAVILEPRKIKSATVSTVSPSICHGVMGPDAMILVF